MSFVIKSLAEVLALIGRYGTQGFIISILAGLALPQLAAAARPFLAVSIFVFVAVTFSRIDLTALAAILRRPLPLILSLAWLTLAPIAMIMAIFALFGRENLDPGLVLGLAILAAAPPIMSSPAVAMLLGLAPTMLMAGVLVTTVAAPFYSPIAAEIVAGAAVPLEIPVLVKRMLLLIGGAILAAAAIRLILGGRRIREHKASFDGVGVVMYFVFAVAAMDGVLAAMIETPMRVLGYLGIAFGISIAGLVGTMLILRPLSPSDRFVLGYATGQRNMGLLVAALGAATPDTTFLFFALAQFPIYLMPQIIKPFSRRFVVPSVTVAQPPRS
jgi:bile acid:Na+ symporter, BASS family